MTFSTLLLIVLICVSFTSANVEKAVFLAPPALNIPLDHPTLDNLRLDTLSPANPRLRIHLEAQFPTNDSDRGAASWFLLDGLSAGQRYEVRICWIATQPTAFRLYPLELSDVFETPQLITSLANFSTSRQTNTDEEQYSRPSLYQRKSEAASTQSSSVLFLQIFAAADYYTKDDVLMQIVPPVFVDVILDPFILNVFPRSLVPTAGYLLIVTMIGWFLSRRVTSWFKHIEPESNRKKQD